MLGIFLPASEAWRELRDSDKALGLFEYMVQEKPAWDPPFLQFQVESSARKL